MLALYDNQPTCAKFNIPRFRNVPSLASVHSNLIRDGLSKRFFVADVFMWLDKILSHISHAWWAGCSHSGPDCSSPPGSNTSTYTFTRKCLTSMLVIPQKTSPLHRWQDRCVNSKSAGRSAPSNQINSGNYRYLVCDYFYNYISLETGSNPYIYMKGTSN